MFWPRNRVDVPTPPKPKNKFNVYFKEGGKLGCIKVEEIDAHYEAISAVKEAVKTNVALVLIEGGKNV